MVGSCWKETNNGTHSIPKNCYYLCQQSDMSTLANIIYRLSYLAKNVTKERKNSHTKRYGSSSLILRKKKVNLCIRFSLSILNNRLLIMRCDYQQKLARKNSKLLYLQITNEIKSFRLDSIFKAYLSHNLIELNQYYIYNSFNKKLIGYFIILTIEKKLLKKAFLYLNIAIDII